MIDHYKNDKSTVFSIVPFLVHEFKPGLYPGEFTIAPCLNDKNPQVLIVGASQHIIHRADEKPLAVITPSFQIAESIVTDFLNGQLWATPEARPGITWQIGAVKVEDFVKSEEFAEMRRLQQNWYVYICKMTDTEWKKSHNGRVVSDQARFAAKVLGLSPEWLSVEVAGFESSKCPACSTVNLNTNVICSNCRFILDDNRFKTMKFAS